MNSVFMIIAEMGPKQSAQMRFTEYDDMIGTLAPNTTVKPLDVGILPGAIWLHNQKGVSPSRPDTRHDHPEQSVSLFQLRAMPVSLEHDELLTKGKILSRQIRDDVELSR